MRHSRPFPAACRAARNPVVTRTEMLSCPRGVDPVGDYIADLAHALQRRRLGGGHPPSVYAPEHAAILRQMRRDEVRQTRANERDQRQRLREAVRAHRARVRLASPRDGHPEGRMREGLAIFLPGQRR